MFIKCLKVLISVMEPLIIVNEPLISVIKCQRTFLKVLGTHSLKVLANLFVKS